MTTISHRFTVRLSADSFSKVHVRKLSFNAGDPVSFDTEHPHVTAVEYLLGAVAADVAGTVRVLGRKRRVALDSVEVLVNAELHDPLVYLRVVGRHGFAGIARIEAKAYIHSSADEDDVRRVWEEALVTCPVINTLEQTVILDLVYQQV